MPKPLMLFMVVFVVWLVAAIITHTEVVRREVKPDPRCNGASRYEAMREAYEARKPDPCNGSKVWVP